MKMKGKYRHYRIDRTTGEEIFLGEVEYTYDAPPEAKKPRTRVRAATEQMIDTWNSRQRIMKAQFEDLVDRACESEGGEI